MYRYIIYFIIIISLLVIDRIKQNYTLDIVIYIFLILLYVGTESALVSIILTLISIALKNIFNQINKKEQKGQKGQIAIGGVFSIVTIAIIIIQNYITVR